MGTVILDSNVVIKHLEGKKNISGIVANHVTTYNDIVFSEVVYTVMRATTGKSPYDLKRMRELPEETRQGLRTVYDLFDYALEYVPIGADITRLARKYIDAYALLPNDALILATGVYYEMDALLTYDSDLLSLEQIKKLKITTPDEFEKQ